MDKLVSKINRKPSQSDELYKITFKAWMMKVLESILGFKQQRSPVLEARNSVVKLIIYLQPLNILFLLLVNHYVPQPYMD